MHHSKQCNKKGHCLSLLGVGGGRSHAPTTQAVTKTTALSQSPAGCGLSAWGAVGAAVCGGRISVWRQNQRVEAEAACGGRSSVWRQKQRVEAEACGQHYSRCRQGSSRGRRGQSPGGGREAVQVIHQRARPTQQQLSPLATLRTQLSLVLQPLQWHLFNKGKTIL